MSSANIEKTNHICLLILCAIAITFSLHFTKDVLVPLVFALVVYEAVLPAVHIFENKWKLPKFVAALLGFMVYLAVMFCIIAFIVNSVGDIARLVELYKSKFSDFGISVMELAGANGFTTSTMDIFGFLKDLPVLGTIKSFAVNIADVLGQISLVSLLVGFLIFGGQRGLPSNHFFTEVNNKISKYLMTKFITSFTTALIVGVILKVFDADLVFAFAFFTFVLNFIPSIGSVFATLLPLPVLALKFGFGLPFFACLILIGVTQFIIGNVLEPKVMGNNLQLHPIAILVFLLFWGIVWGIPGMFLSVPITASLKILLERMDATKPFARLLEGKIG